MKKGLSYLLYSTLILTSLFISGCEKKDRTSLNNKQKIEKLQLPQEKNEYVDIDVYFDASKDESKVEISKEEILVNKEDLIGQLIVDQLIKGPGIKSKLTPVLPRETRLLSYSSKDGVAIINLSKEAQVAMSRGKEEACLKSIASSLAQLSSISKIMILIENKNVETLGGNFDITKPFGKDELVERKK